METQKSNRIKKTLAILLAVLFLVTVTVTTVSAYTTIGGETNDRNTIVIHDKHFFGGHDDKHRFGDRDDRARKNRDNKLQVRPQIRNG
jgi:hypothetical protein